MYGGMSASYPSEPDSSLEICNKIMDRRIQALIWQAALLENAGNRALAARNRESAGYGGMHD